MENEVFLITTVEAAGLDNLIVRSYHISKLREISQLSATVFVDNGRPVGIGQGAPPSTMTEPWKKLSAEPGTKQPQQQFALKWEAGLMQTVIDFSTPACRWVHIDAEGGTLRVAGNRLIVRQTRTGHEQVVAVLEQLEMAAEDIAAEAAE